MPLFVRSTLPQDQQFVYQLEYQTMFEQLYAGTWDPRIRQQLLDMQIRAKQRAYAGEFPNADYAIVMLDDQPVGRMVIDRTGEFYVLVDIAIVPERRSAGIGTQLILALCREAELVHKKIRLHVSVTNSRAGDLYKRLGFRVIQDLETGMLMEHESVA